MDFGNFKERCYIDQLVISGMANSDQWVYTNTCIYMDNNVDRMIIENAKSCMRSALRRIARCEAKVPRIMSGMGWN